MREQQMRTQHAQIQKEVTAVRAAKVADGLRAERDELQLCVETVTSAVMKNAEESARLLAKLALTEGPDAALREALAKRNEGLEKLTLKNKYLRNFGKQSSGEKSSGKLNQTCDPTCNSSRIEHLER